MANLAKDKGELAIALERAAAKQGVTVAEMVAGLLAKKAAKREGAPVRRPGSGRVPSGLEGAETDEWAEYERQDGGVLSPAGMTAGGIFGEGAVATSFHDPGSLRAARREADRTEARRLVQRLHKHIDDGDQDALGDALAGLLGVGAEDDE